jgi:uncharacterized membrane protein
MNIVISVSFIALAILLVHWYIDAWRGLIPLQNSVGIKTRATMASEETWFAIHHKYAYMFLWVGIFLGIAGLEVAAFAIADRSLNNVSNTALLGVITIFVVMLIFTVGVGITANQEAERLNEERYRAGK